MVTYLGQLVQSRELLYRWTRREFNVRYAQSVLGVIWAIVQPMALMVVFSVVFSVLIQVPTNNVPYPVFAYCALLPWTFFSNALSLAIPSLVNNFNLVSRIYFPREILPLATIIVSFIDFLIAAVVFVGLLAYYQIPLGAAVLFVPVVVALQLVFTLAIALFAAAFNVFYRDVRFLVPLILQVWLYLCPIVYPVELVPERFQSLYFLNPLATIIETYRRLILHNQMPDWPYFMLTVAISLLLLLVSYRYFKRAEVRFADLI